MAATAHGTLTPDEVEAVTIEVNRFGFEVVNRTLSGAIWVRFDGVDPEVAGADSYVVLGARRFPFSGSAKTIEVRLLSTDELDYSVEGRDTQ